MKSYINSRNDAIPSSNGRNFGEDNLTNEEINNAAKRDYHGDMMRRYKNALTLVNPWTGKPLSKFQTPTGLGTDNLQRATAAQRYCETVNESRDAEGLVFINGRRVPGIFQGFKTTGGLEVDKFDKARVKINKAKTAGKDVQTFSVVKNILPFQGSCSFLLLDDNWSSALQKCRDFARIMTWFVDKEDKAKHVVTIESFLIGADRPFNFSTIIIPSFSVDMDNQTEGALSASFDFQQYEIFEGEAKFKEPGTTPNRTGGNVNLYNLTVDFNPVLDAQLEVEEVAL
jgi:hypothetical protein